jgi:hypothetical protein
MMMEIKKIIEVLQAFKEGKRVVLAENHGGHLTRRKGQQANNLEWILLCASEGAHFEIAREPKTVWFPSFYGHVSCFTEQGFISELDCNQSNSAKPNYTGAVEFREVIDQGHL